MVVGSWPGPLTVTFSPNQSVFENQINLFRSLQSFVSCCISSIEEIVILDLYDLRRCLNKIVRSSFEFYRSRAWCHSPYSSWYQPSASQSYSQQPSSQPSPFLEDIIGHNRTSQDYLNCPQVIRTHLECLEYVQQFFQRLKMFFFGQQRLFDFRLRVYVNKIFSSVRNFCK